MSFAEIAPRLIEKARRIAEARGQELALERRDPPRRWRKATLLWPNFTKG